MTDQEALLRWLRIAWEKGAQREELLDAMKQGMPLATAVREYDAPLQPSLSELMQEVNDLMLSWGDEGKLRLPL